MYSGVMCIDASNRYEFFAMRILNITLNLGNFANSINKIFTNRPDPLLHSCYNGVTARKTLLI